MEEMMIKQHNLSDYVRKKEVIIHVGYPKTGTTFLQEEIFKKMNVLYIRDISLTSFSFVHTDKVIISNESLSMVDIDIEPEKKYIVAKFLSRLFPDAKIVLGIRKKDDLLKSLYSQYIRNGGTYSWNEFVKHFDEGHLDYQSYLSYLKLLFNDNVFVYNFEELKQNKKQLISDLCAFIGEPVPDYRDKKYRVSLKPYQLKTLRFFNKLPLPYNIKRVGRYIINTVSNSKPQKLCGGEKT